MVEKGSSKTFYVRLPVELAEKVEFIAMIERYTSDKRRTMNDVIQDAVAGHIESKFRDPTFLGQLEEFRERIGRLAEGFSQD